MALYTWLFGDKNKIPLRRANQLEHAMGDSFYHSSASFSPEDEIKSLRDIKRFFLWYIHIFKFKKNLLVKSERDWALGRMKLFINCCKTMLWAINKELNVSRREKNIIKFILSNQDILKIPNINQITALLDRLTRNLENQLPMLEYLTVHQDYNLITKKLAPLISEEEKLLFSESIVLDRLLNAIQRESIANNIPRSRSEIYGHDIFTSTMSEIEAGLHFKFDDAIDELTKLGKPVKILDIGCDVGVCLKQLYHRYKGLVELYGIAPGWQDMWKANVRETLESANIIRMRNPRAHTPSLNKISDISEDELRQWKPSAITFRVAHMENLPRYFPDNFFHFIYSHFGIYHSSHLHETLTGCYKILKKGGLLSFNVRESVFEVKSIIKSGLRFEILNKGHYPAPIRRGRFFSTRPDTIYYYLLRKL